MYAYMCRHAGHPVPPFANYGQFIDDVQKAINDEVSAVQFYTDLMAKAPCDAARQQIKEPRDDEIKHYRMLRGLYKSLTGYDPMVIVSKTPIENFCSSVTKALNDELDTSEFYRRMYLSTTDMRIRDILFEIMTDEMTHATRFTFVFSLVGCQDKQCKITG